MNIAYYKSKDEQSHEFLYAEGTKIPEELIAKDRKTKLFLAKKEVFGQGMPQPGDRVIIPMSRHDAKLLALQDEKVSDEKIDIDERIADILNKTPYVVKYTMSYGAYACTVKVKDDELTYEVPMGMLVEPGDSVLVPFKDELDSGEVKSIFRLKQVAAKY